MPRRAADRLSTESLFVYPEHLRAQAEAAPARPGVYTFHGQAGDLPLYIGKSVNLRARLLSHLRTAEEARMLRQTQRISFIRTAGEVGALLLEAQMIKTHHPLFNQKLRRSRQLCSLLLADGGPRLVFANELDFARTPQLYGLFTSRHAAQTFLHEVADEQRLCLSSLGLEKRRPGQACFRHALQRCAGLCCGKETAADHHSRLLGRLEAMQVACWPYPGAMGLVERDEELTQVHVVQNWCYLGSAPSLAQARRQFKRTAAGFDADGYRILMKPVLTGTVKVVPLDPSAPPIPLQ